MRIISLLPLLIASICYSAPIIATDMIAVVTAANSPLKKLSLRTLKRIYLRKKRVGINGNRLIPLNLKIKNSLRREFSMALFSMLPEEQSNYWNNQYFHGISPPKVMMSEKSVARFVASTPGSIGYIRQSKVNSKLKILFLIKPLR